MPQISIIIPVFNASSYLTHCLQSVLEQSFSDFELLLIDDGSCDGSSLICDSFAAKDERIRVFHKINEGVSKARNLGLSNVKSDWVTFIDADDFIDKSYIEGLFRPIAEGISVDFVHGGCMNFKNGRKTSINQHYAYFVGDDKGKLFSTFRGLVVSKLFKMEIIKSFKLQFDESMIIAEDMAFALDYLFHINRYAFVPETGYYYRTDSVSSVTHKTKPISYAQAHHSFMHLYNSTIQYIETYNISNRDAEIRLEQRATQFLSMIQSLYRESSFKKSSRIELIKNELDSKVFLLDYIKDRPRCFLSCFLLMNKWFRLFDTLQLIIVFLKDVKSKVCSL